MYLLSTEGRKRMDTTLKNIYCMYCMNEQMPYDKNIYVYTVDTPSHHRKGVKIPCQNIYDGIYLFTNVSLWYEIWAIGIKEKHHNNKSEEYLFSDCGTSESWQRHGFITYSLQWVYASDFQPSCYRSSHVSQAHRGVILTVKVWGFFQSAWCAAALTFNWLQWVGITCLQSGHEPWPTRNLGDWCLRTDPYSVYGIFPLFRHAHTHTVKTQDHSGYEMVCDVHYVKHMSRLGADFWSTLCPTDISQLLRAAKGNCRTKPPLSS